VVIGVHAVTECAAIGCGAIECGAIECGAIELGGSVTAFLGRALDVGGGCGEAMYFRAVRFEAALRFEAAQ
jgi:hypothetical protein